MSRNIPEEVLKFFNGRFVVAKSGKQFEGIGLPWVDYSEDEKISFNKKNACKNSGKGLNFK
jgi:hypothetical protein